MELKQLKYFLTITETLNITKAAEKLHMSQPPLTHQLKLLEEELGTKLFNRTTRKLELTKAGEKLRERARQLLDLADTTINDMNALNQGQHQELAIGFVASSMALLSPQKLQDFHIVHPDLSFTMREGNTHRILDLLNHGLIDIGLVRTPFNGEPYNVVYLEPEPMIAVYDEGSYNFSKVISLKELSKLPLVLDKRFMNLIVNTSHTEGFEPLIICKAEDSRSILSWIESGLGIAILPLSGQFFLNQQNLKYAVIDSKDLETRNAIVSLKQQNSHLVNEFIKNIKSY